MKNIDKINIPYRQKIAPGIYATVVTVNDKKGSVVFGYNEDGWEHVSFSPFGGKMPSWDDMCKIKDLFFDDEEDRYIRKNRSMSTSRTTVFTFGAILRCSFRHRNLKAFNNKKPSRATALKGFYMLCFGSPFYFYAYTQSRA